MPRGQSSKHGQAQRCFNEALLVAQLGRRSSTPRHSLHGGKGVSRRHPVSISPQNRRRPLPEGRPASTGPRSSGRSARGRPGAGCTRRTAARSQPSSTLDPSRLGLCSEERAHVSRVRGAVIGPDDMEAGRGSEPARTLARPAWSRLWMVGSKQRSWQALDISLVSLALLVAVQRELDRAHHAARAARRLDRHLPRRRRPAAEHATLVLLGRALLRAPSAPGAPSGRPSSLWAQRTSRAPTPLAAA